MLFQTLDDKHECVGIYCDKTLVFDKDKFPEALSKTWKYSAHMRERDNIEYANLYVGNKKIEEVIPEYLKDDWHDVSSRLLSFRRSLKISKVSLEDNCIYDLVPERFLMEFCEVKNRITEHVLENYEKPQRYKYLLNVCQMLEDISNHRLNINTRKLNTYLKNHSSTPGMSRLKDVSPYIRYNQFGTKTGRLTTREDSFPILTLKRDLRSIVEPRNDYIMELDFNGAEVRVMMGLLDIPQPQGDVHKFHSDEVFGGTLTRERVKTAFFAWLYGSKSAKNSPEGKVLEKFYDKGKILDQHWDGKTVHTTFRKKIFNVDEHHALNYIVQSTAAELTLLQAVKIDYLLRSRGAKSRIMCIIHDAIVFDFNKEDEELIPDIKKLMSSTKFGNFEININKGTNLGALKGI